MSKTQQTETATTPKGRTLRVERSKTRNGGALYSIPTGRQICLWTKGDTCNSLENALAWADNIIDEAESWSDDPQVRAFARQIPPTV